MTARRLARPALMPAPTEPAAAAAVTLLARFVPSASPVSEQTIDQWIECEQRRSRCSVRAGIVVLAVASAAAAALALLP